MADGSPHWSGRYTIATLNPAIDRAMLISFFGTPSDLTLAGTRLLQALMQAVFGDYHWIAAGTAEELASAWTARQHAHTLLFADIPDARITALLAEANAPMAVFLDKPAAIVRSLAPRRKLTSLPALRLASQSLATLHDLAVNAATAVITAQHAQARLVDILDGLAAHYRIAMPRSAVESALAALAPPTAKQPSHLLDLIPPLTEPPSAPDAATASDADVALAREALGGYDPLFAGRHVEAFFWPKGVFLGAEPMGAALARTGAVSLVGGARCFVFGPYFHLPAGRWRAEVKFSVADNISGNKLKVDVFTDSVIFQDSCTLPAQGSFQLTLTFDVIEPRLPIQLRFYNERGAIEGRFDLHGVTVTRAGGVGR
jgi:hypothetical protein